MLQPAVSPRAKVYRRDSATIHFDRAEHLYDVWPEPVCIVSDGPYGLSGYPGDLPTVGGLTEWYRPHVEAWTKRSTPQTTLWFWSSELGWATVHSLLSDLGWEYRNCHVWDKGMGHVAGNANTQTLRKFPVITEVCVQYVKSAEFDAEDGKKLTMQDWLRAEWRRSGLPFRLANTACQVANAATRKYLTADHLWYYPPPEAFARIAEYANAHGKPEGRPYFSLDGGCPVGAEEWGKMRAKFKCAAGISNVWRLPHVAGKERLNGVRERMRSKFKCLHGSQKPLSLVETAILSSTDRDDVVWEPFGGLCPVAVSALKLGRRSYSAEIIREFYDAAANRLRNASTA